MWHTSAPNLFQKQECWECSVLGGLRYWSCSIHGTTLFQNKEWDNLFNYCFALSSSLVLLSCEAKVKKLSFGWDRHISSLPTHDETVDVRNGSRIVAKNWQIVATGIMLWRGGPQTSNIPGTNSSPLYLLFLIESLSLSDWSFGSSFSPFGGSNNLSHSKRWRWTISNDDDNQED